MEMSLFVIINHIQSLYARNSSLKGSIGTLVYTYARRIENYRREMNLEFVYQELDIKK